MRTVSIVGGGWSFGNIDHNKLPGEVIAVNDSAFYLERRPDYVVGMDRLWTEHRWTYDPKGKGGLVGLRLPTYIRRAALKKIPIADGFGWLRSFECDIHSKVLTEDLKELNGPNSGHCALNLAYILRPKELYLFGFDMCRNAGKEAYWYPSYEWTGKPKGATGARRYVEWVDFIFAAADQFKAIGCRVINVSPLSAIQCFEKKSARELGILKQ